MFLLDAENELLYNFATVSDNSINGDALMAKLEELVTPTELLSAIKEGSLKQEIVKKYKASEQELAMMLLPLYRKGDLTKEEFNDFFKGVSLRKPEEGAEAVAPKTEDEPPSEILKSLSKIFGKRSHEEKQTSTEEPPPTGPALEPGETEAAAHDVATEGVPEAASELTAEPAAEPEGPFEPEVAAESVPETDEERGEAAIEPPAEVAAEVVEAQAGEGSTEMDSADISGLLNSIFAKLNSIDKRLEAIEQKVLNE
jgi:hypothetical protein